MAAAAGAAGRRRQSKGNVLVGGREWILAERPDDPVGGIKALHEHLRAVGLIGTGLLRGFDRGAYGFGLAQVGTEFLILYADFPAGPNTLNQIATARHHPNPL